MKFRSVYFLLLTSCLILSGCNSGETPLTDGSRISYPYQASPERKAQIMNGIKSLHVGMTESETLHLLGDADERNIFYLNAENFETRKADGFVLVYLLQRLEPFGGMVQRKEKSFRLEFGNDKRLKKVEAIEVQGVPAKFLPR